MVFSGKVLLLLCSLALALTVTWSKSPEHRHHHHRHHHHHHRHHHHHHHHRGAADAEPVLLEVFYETLCPNSIAFIKNQLYPTVQQIISIVNVSMVPYGKATQTKDGDNWDFTCQHGPRECVGNIVESCALKYIPQNVVDPATNIPRVLTLINCMETATDPSSAGPDCAKQQDIDFAPSTPAPPAPKETSWST
ncbi:gamma-interferon-inducible lysosomal thiol reductase-like [Paramacrobiotus metropolitanus]|uniref:gamma-interferon-inducible lysosomal thiol reductase-like n=1 Tax=Paramacrobiotus metropolitanus TaxID=2943436 RepID=UPI00244589F1|nr:gamma-interferon-inducible lysosomal thiol reductase-like [Paramacrobiotus metropolitanus]